MKTYSEYSTLSKLFLASRPKFLTASASPVLVGSALGFAVAQTFDWPLFLLALFGIMFLHAGANIANDYFDHVTGNDWLNKNVTPFSGGSRFIQKGLLSPKSTLLAALFCLTTGAALGTIILMLKPSIFILLIGIIGLLGGFFYTAPPVKIGYRGFGEIFIAFLFGILPVYGAYYLQTGTIDLIPMPAACIVGLLVFLIILINEFPDLPADAAVNKKTLVVHFGVPLSAWIYRIAVIVTFIIVVTGAFLYRLMFWPCILYLLFGLPLGVAAIIFSGPKALSTQGKTQHRACAITITFHLVGSLALMAGFILWPFIHR